MSHGPRILVCALAGFLAIGCAPPPDASRSRPEAVPSTPFAQHDVQLLGVRIRMIDEGPRDAPIVVLIPGHTSRIEEYDGLVPVLARRHRVLVLDPGFVRMYFDMAADQVERSLFALAPQIHQPVWLGWGDQDHGANMGAGVARLAELLPRSELRVFPGARHSLAAEIPDELAAALEEFLLRSEDALPKDRTAAPAEPDPDIAP